MEILRATETWQRAGAYYVRIQAMAKKHHITLRQEFDEHDGEGTRYIVITHEDFPVATARMYQLDDRSVMIGRVVVLPEYRDRGLGVLVMTEAEKWIRECGYGKIELSSRVGVEGFYEKLGYVRNPEFEAHSGTFECTCMEKKLD